MSPNPTHLVTRPDPITRRSLFQVGLSAAALGGLAACGGSPSAPASSAASSAPAAAALSAKTSEIPVGGGKIFTDAQTVITQPVAGTYKAFSSVCTHARCPVAAVTSTIDCNCHGSKFSLTDGSPTTGPATQPLPAKTVTVSGESLSVSA